MGRQAGVTNGNGQSMDKLTVLIEEEQVKLLEEKVEAGDHKNVSEACRAAVRIYNKYGEILESIDYLQKLSQDLGLQSIKQLPAYVDDLRKTVNNLSYENREILQSVESKLELLSVYQKLEAERDARKKLEEQIKN